MGRVIKTWRDPYGEGFSPCRRKEVEFQSGLTVLVGCNGAGKSTMIHNLKSVLEKEDIPVFYFDNEHHGGANARSKSFFEGNIELGALAMNSSEGENISLNLGSCAAKWRKFLETGDNGDSINRLAAAIARRKKEEEKEKELSKERWILLDAMDSGFSIDNVIEMKDLFGLVIEDAKKFGVELYIVISSNEYELAHEANCMDVTEGKYIKFANYDEYKKFILHTRTKKDKRYK